MLFLLPLIVVTMTLNFSCNQDDEMDSEDSIEIPEGYSLLWSEEFNEQIIDATKWNYETGDGTDYGLPPGWGNSELQLYTENSDNSGITSDEDLSVLQIQAQSDGSGGYSSAKLTSQSLFSMRFGRIDVKAKLPNGQGIWPAIWLLGDNVTEIPWPGCGEIDIMEMLGHDPARIYSTLHFTNDENRHGEIQEPRDALGSNFHEAYHVFSLDWTPESLNFSLDGIQYQQVGIQDDMKEFLRSFYLILNVAVGGNWPGDPDDTTTFPQSMYVDYVRVFSQNGFEAKTAPPLVIEEESIGEIIQDNIAQYAIQDNFSDLGNASVSVWGGGGEPGVSASDISIDGDSSLVFEFPGGNWGGGYIELDIPKDLSAYSFLHFSLHKPDSLVDAEIKLESLSANAPVFLIDYSSSDAGMGFVEYTIPLADFVDLPLQETRIPFAIWNPKDENESFTAGTVLIDNIYFSN
ncbi:MAG: glycoside hydrolase family 16 protein [Saprospiraceae bacterium]|nr:glycoside hydrolase family 16 protein [Saprospiraceae bacterium]